MPIEIIIPRLGWTMEEGNFVSWLKKDGEHVNSGEPLFSLENEKAVQDVEATDSGTLRIPTDGPKPGQGVKVGQVIGHLLTENEFRETRAVPALPVLAEPDQAKSPEVAANKSSLTLNEANPQIATKRAISPRARRLAADLGIDATRLCGSGRTGRVIEKDVRQAGK